MSPYEMIGGEEGIRKLSDAFYEVMHRRKEAAGIRAMHGEDLTEIKQKLFEFLSGWLGGPALYYEKYGTVCLTEPHAGYAIGANERDQWMDCMMQALDEVGAPAEFKEMVKGPLFSVADMVRNS